MSDPSPGPYTAGAFSPGSTAYVEGNPTDILAGAQAVAFVYGQRLIGGILPTVTVRESHTDELEITQHPVETGASISDHAYKVPSRVSVECGFGGIGGRLLVLGVYEVLQQMQAQRQPFGIVTGKRLYQNMLMRRLSVETDAATETVLMVSAEFEEIIIVQTQTVSVPAQASQAMPSRTAGPVEVGDVQPVPVTGPTPGFLRGSYGGLTGYSPAAKPPITLPAL